MKLFSRLTLTLLIAPICQAKQIPPRVEERVPKIEIEIVQEKPTNQKPQVIIQSVANVLANVGAIVDAPRDKQNVVQAVTGILANVINIVLAAGKRDHKSRLELFTIICNELHLDDAIREIIKQKIEELQQD